MDVAIALGQGTGLAVACGLIALLPVAVGAGAALAGALPGMRAVYDDLWVIVAAAIGGVVLAAAWPRLGAPIRLAVAAVAGAGAFELAAGDEAPFVGLAVGAALAAGSAWIGNRLLAGVGAGVSSGGLVANLAGAGAVAAALAIVPFLGYLLALGAGWFAIRLRRQKDAKYAGLRVLR